MWWLLQEVYKLVRQDEAWNISYIAKHLFALNTGTIATYALAEHALETGTLWTLPWQRWSITIYSRFSVLHTHWTLRGEPFLLHTRHYYSDYCHTTGPACNNIEWRPYNLPILSVQANWLWAIMQQTISNWRMFWPHRPLSAADKTESVTCTSTLSSY